MEYVPDLQYEEASKLVKKLSEEGAKVTKNEKLLIYYIQKNYGNFNKTKERLNRYDEVLAAFKSILPKEFDANTPIR